MTTKHIQSLITQVRADIATRKTMPEYGSTPDAAIERIKTINETQRSFALETVEALLNALDVDKKMIAANEQEPFGFVTRNCAEHMHDDDSDEKHWMWSISAVVIGCDPKLKHEVPVYLHPAPLISDLREAVRKEHAEWSQATFGDVGPVGPLKHLAKEAIEAAAEPCDLSEWADMQFLLWDAQRRAGITDKQINLAMIEKLAVNKTRSWPAPKDGEPRLHIKSAEGGSQ